MKAGKERMLSQVHSQTQEGTHIMTKVGINGFGRIGRLVFRGMLDRDDLDAAWRQLLIS